jgi:hypothetical protein
MPEPSAAFFIPAAIAVLGALMLIVSGVARLLNGAVQIRPLSAIKRVPMFIVILVPITLLLRLVLPSNLSAMESLGLAVFMSIFFSFYSTAYRKPA